MTPQIALLLAILGIALALFISEKLRPDLVAILVMLSLGIVHLVTPAEAYSGFSNSSVIVIMAVFILTGGLVRTGVSARLGRWLVRVAGQSEFRMVLVVALAAAGLSLFMNNIAAATVVMPAVIDVSRRTKISPSKLLMPMAMATQLGGMATLFTTSNLVTSGILQGAGLRGFGLFDFLSVGGVAAVAGILYIAFLGRRWLPDRRPMEEARRQQELRRDLVGAYQLKERLQAAVVPAASPLVGQSLAQAAIGDQLGLTVLAIERNGRTLLAPTAQEVIYPEDVLLVEGRAERAAQLEARGMQVSPAAAEAEALISENVEWLEVLVAPRSDLIGKTLKEIQFRTKYDASVVALWQGDRAYRTDVGGIVLQGGEALLIQGPRAKIDLLRADPNWIVLQLNGAELFRTRKMRIALAILALTLVVAALNVLPIATVMFLGALAMVFTGCLTMDEAYRAIEWKAVFLVAGMLPVGLALIDTGAAKMVGGAVISLLGGFGPLAVLGGLFLVSMTFEQIVPGGSAVPAVMAPIAIAAAEGLHADPRAFALVIAIATGTSTMTPFAHPVNVLVMGPGNYHFRDYVRAGLPLVFVTFVVVMTVLPLFWHIGGS